MSTEEIRFNNILEILFAGKKLIISVLVICFLAGAFYSLSISNKFTSKAILAFTQDSPELNSNLSSLAAFAGFETSQISTNNLNEAIALIQSRTFFNRFVSERSILPELLALISWDGNIKKYDENIYDVEKNQWLGLEENIVTPSEEEAHKYFLENFSINKNRDTGLIEISFTSRSNKFSKKILEMLIEDINDYYRERDVQRLMDRISFLNDEISKVSVSEIRLSMSNLLSNYMSELAVANMSNSYIFEYIDNPSLPEKKSFPRRKLIVSIFVISGLISSVLFLLLLFLFDKKISKDKLFKLDNIQSQSEKF